MKSWTGVVLLMACVVEPYWRFLPVFICTAFYGDSLSTCCTPKKGGGLLFSSYLRVWGGNKMHRPARRGGPLSQEQMEAAREANMLKEPGDDACVRSLQIMSHNDSGRILMLPPR